ncbi:MAG TPA: hypothetical protein VJ742_12065 [Nitrososphaera sp.]|nr:hypothetical protein [Nitrososphaera sp.]
MGPMDRKVFLSGGIEGCEDRGLAWRLKAQTLLEKHGFVVESPLIIAPNMESPFNEVNEIVHRDLYLLRQCDMILVEYNIPNRCYIGTDVEMVKAHELGMPIIVWSNEQYRNRVYLRYLATAILPTLEDAVDYMRRFY